MSDQRQSKKLDVDFEDLLPAEDLTSSNVNNFKLNLPRGPMITQVTSRLWLTPILEGVPDVLAQKAEEALKSQIAMAGRPYLMINLSTRDLRCEYSLRPHSEPLNPPCVSVPPSLEAALRVAKIAGRHLSYDKKLMIILYGVEENCILMAAVLLLYFKLCIRPYLCFEIIKKSRAEETIPELPPSYHNLLDAIAMLAYREIKEIRSRIHNTPIALTSLSIAPIPAINPTGLLVEVFVGDAKVFATAQKYDETTKFRKELGYARLGLKNTLIKDEVTVLVSHARHPSLHESMGLVPIFTFNFNLRFLDGKTTCLVFSKNQLDVHKDADQKIECGFKASLIIEYRDVSLGRLPDYFLYDKANCSRSANLFSNSDEYGKALRLLDFATPSQLPDFPSLPGHASFKSGKINFSWSATFPGFPGGTFTATKLDELSKSSNPPSLPQFSQPTFCRGQSSVPPTINQGSQTNQRNSMYQPDFALESLQTEGVVIGKSASNLMFIYANDVGVTLVSNEVQFAKVGHWYRFKAQKLLIPLPGCEYVTVDRLANCDDLMPTRSLGSIVELQTVIKIDRRTQLRKDGFFVAESEDVGTILVNETTTEFEDGGKLTLQEIKTFDLLEVVVRPWLRRPGKLEWICSLIRPTFIISEAQMHKRPLMKLCLVERFPTDGNREFNMLLDDLNEFCADFENFGLPQHTPQFYDKPAPQTRYRGLTQSTRETPYLNYTTTRRTTRPTSASTSPKTVWDTKNASDLLACLWNIEGIRLEAKNQNYNLYEEVTDYIRHAQNSSTHLSCPSTTFRDGSSSNRQSTTFRAGSTYDYDSSTNGSNVNYYDRSSPNYSANINSQRGGPSSSYDRRIYQNDSQNASPNSYGSSASLGGRQRWNCRDA